jgi:hypothetical protein
MTRVDCAERMFRFKQRCPQAVFDLTPSLFTASVPGRAEPFRAMNLCDLMNAVEHWAAGQAMAGPLFKAARPAPASSGQRRNDPDTQRRNDMSDTWETTVRTAATTMLNYAERLSDGLVSRTVRAT